MARRAQGAVEHEPGYVGVARTSGPLLQLARSLHLHRVPPKVPSLSRLLLRASWRLPLARLVSPTPPQACSRTTVLVALPARLSRYVRRHTSPVLLPASLSLRHLADGSLHLLSCTQAEDFLIKAPKSLFITSEVAVSQGPFPTFNEWSYSTEPFVLFVLHHRLAQNSAWKPYVGMPHALRLKRVRCANLTLSLSLSLSCADTLPNEFSANPLSWTDADLEELQASPIRGTTRRT